MLWIVINCCAFGCRVLQIHQLVAIPNEKVKNSSKKRLSFKLFCISLDWLKLMHFNWGLEFLFWSVWILDFLNFSSEVLAQILPAYFFLDSRILLNFNNQILCLKFISTDHNFSQFICYNDTVSAITVINRDVCCQSGLS